MGIGVLPGAYPGKFVVSGDALICDRDIHSRVANTVSDDERGFKQDIDGTEKLHLFAANSNDIYLQGNGGTTKIQINPDGDVLPGADATQDLGSTSLRWGTVYSAGLSVESGAAPNVEFKVTNTQSTNTNKALTINNNDTTSGLDISYRGEILPKADADVNLGGPSNRWANIYSADLQLSNEGAANEVDGTWGQYTIQEGEDDLFLINRRSGKKYKFMLQEVQ